MNTNIITDPTTGEQHMDPMDALGLWMDREAVSDEEIADDLPGVMRRYWQHVEGESGTLAMAGMEAVTS